MADKKDFLKRERPFSYRWQKGARAQVFYKNKPVCVLTGKDALKLERIASEEGDYGMQLFLARVTGNFKRGNERNGDSHKKG